MFDEIRKELSSFKLLITLSTIAVLIYLLQFAWGFLGVFSDVIVMLIFSWLLSFILEPIVIFFAKYLKLSKTLSALLTFTLLVGALTLVIFIFVPAVSYQFVALSKIIPKFLSTAPIYVQRWNTYLTSSLDSTISFIPSVANFLFSIFIVFVLAFYLVVDGDRINRELIGLTPLRWHKNLRIVEGIINETFASFLRVQLLFGLIFGLVTWIVLRIFSVDFAASTALLAGILTVIPMIGPILAMIPPLFISFISDPFKALIIFIILLVIQQFIFNIWGPRLMGKTFRIHPIVVILSFLIGLRAAGIVGGIFAVPVFSIVTLIIRDLGHLFITPEPESKP